MLKRMNADEFARNTEFGLVVIEIEREMIEAGNIASVLERLMVMIDDLDSMMRYRESVTFCVNGYDADLRELAEIPEVKAFFVRLVAEWPFWLWFLIREHRQIQTLMAILCEVQVHERSSGNVLMGFADIDDVLARLEDMGRRGYGGLMSAGVTEWECNKSMLSAILEVLPQEA